MSSILRVEVCSGISSYTSAEELFDDEISPGFCCLHLSGLYLWID